MVSDQWLSVGEDPRVRNAPPRGERECLVGYLDYYRTTLELKCAELTPEQLATRSVPPSPLSLLGLVRHLTRVEQLWWRRVIEGHWELERLFVDEDAGFEVSARAVDADAVSAAWEQWTEEVQHAREVLASADLDALVESRGEQVEVRDVVVHLVEEYARHVGHADLLRECLDGRTGQ